MNSKAFGLFASLLLVGCEDLGAHGGDTARDVVDWTTPECEFLVQFPGKPEEITREVSGIGQFQTARLSVGDAAFQADCTILPADVLSVIAQDPKGKLKEMLLGNAQSSGIDNVDIELLETRGITVGTASGSKMVEGSRVTYMSAAAVGDKTLISTMVAARSHEFPMLGQMQFLDSIRQKPAE